MQEFRRYFSERYMQPFYADFLIGNTKAVEEFKERGYPESFAWSKGRLIDDAEAILNEYRESDLGNRQTKLPICVMSASRNVVPSGLDYGRSTPHKQLLKIKESETQVEARLTILDRPIQIAFFAAKEADARSLAMQFCLYVSELRNRRFYSDYTMPDGSIAQFPCVLEDNRVIPENVPTDQKNLCISTITLTFKESAPFVAENTEGLVEEVHGQLTDSR